MKSIIFDLSVNRQHGEPAQGLRAADMFLSPPRFPTVPAAIEMGRCAIRGGGGGGAGVGVGVVCFCFGGFLSLLAPYARGTHPLRFIILGMSVAFSLY